MLFYSNAQTPSCDLTLSGKIKCFVNMGPGLITQFQRFSKSNWKSHMPLGKFQTGSSMFQQKLSSIWMKWVGHCCVVYNFKRLSWRTAVSLTLPQASWWLLFPCLFWSGHANLDKFQSGQIKGWEIKLEELIIVL